MRRGLEMLLRPGQKVYLVGVGGIGMSGLARVLRARGLVVGGSDVKRTKLVSQLEAEGIHVDMGHIGNFKDRPNLLVFSSAISDSNPDLVTARASGIPVFHRADVLSFLMNQGISIAITGTHGKTTSSAMAAFLMTVCIGIRNQNGRAPERGKFKNRTCPGASNNKIR